MKKKVCVVLAIVMAAALFALCGCSGEEEDQPDPNENPYAGDVEASALAEYLYDNITFQDEMNGMDRSLAFQLYGIEEDDVIDGAVYMSTGATAEEIAVFTVADDEGALLVANAYDTRLADQKKGFENYVPEELAKLDDAIVMQVNNAVVLLVVNDTSEAETALSSYIEAYLSESETE